MKSTSESNQNETGALKVTQSWARNETIIIKDGVRKACWSNSFSNACKETVYSEIEEGAILFTQDAGQCANKSNITVVTHN